MPQHYPLIPEECETCPLPDCYHESRACPLNKNYMVPRAPRTRSLKLEGVAPENYDSRQEYIRQYNRVYYQTRIKGKKEGGK